MKSTLYGDGETYDKIFNYEDDIGFWQNLTKGKDGVLELCCGTGRMIVSLRPSHKDLTGIDNSAEMLATAKAKASGPRTPIQFYKRNITRFNLGRTYNTILLVNNSFGHLHTESEVLKFQACLKKHMTLNTEFILQILPKNGLKIVTFNKLTPWAKFKDSADKKVVEVFQKVEYASENKVIKREFFYYKENKLVQKRSTLVRIYEPAEIRQLFEKNGFRLIKEYGGYNYEPYKFSSPRYIAVLKKIK
jgi:ubiquinone/menaquinone biosynthesis C-methylase UbiE